MVTGWSRKTSGETYSAVPTKLDRVKSELELEPELELMLLWLTARLSPH
jgi:hypothetical protein